MSDFVDRTLSCVECGNDFVFSAGEQQFFADRQFRNEPKRCKLCKAKRATAIHTGAFMKRETPATCENCGRQTTLPFRPTQGRPVYCRECYQGRRASAASAGADASL
jgi:CxxC-x17-CxxC domain-containing protein